MSQELKTFCKKLREVAQYGDEYGKRAEPDATLLEAAAGMLERCYEILNFEGPDGRYRDELNDLATKAMKPEPRSTSQKGGGQDLENPEPR